MFTVLFSIELKNVFYTLYFVRSDVHKLFKSGEHNKKLFSRIPALFLCDTGIFKTR